MGEQQSDKGHQNIQTSWHNYTVLYHELFHERRMEDLRIFELGLGTNYEDVPSNMGAKGRPGASLYGWKEYFPNADIHGADIDRRILFEDDRIHTYYCDQTDPSAIADLWATPALHGGFDIIIEDGLHTLDANICFFEHSIQKLRVGGYYIMEDIHGDYLAVLENKLEEWRVAYPMLTFALFRLPSRVNPYDNNVLVVQRMS